MSAHGTSNRGLGSKLYEAALQAACEQRFATAVKLLRESFEIDPGSATGHRAYLADLLKHGGDLANLVRIGPPRLNTLIHSGWLNSLIHVTPVDAKGKPIPWFTYPAIDFLEPKVQPHWNVLEWGCGNSTLWWADRVKQVTSIEHNAEWHRAITAQAPSNAHLHLVEDLDRYSGFHQVGETFDVIVIDGEDRNRCTATAIKQAAPHTLIILDNSDRSSLRGSISLLADAGWRRIDFFGLLPAYLYRTCTSIFYKDDAFLNSGALPCDVQTCIGLTCAQVLGE